MSFAVKELKEYSTSKVCRLLKISRSSYYYKKRKAERRERIEESLKQAVYAMFKLHHGSFGRRVLKKELSKTNVKVSEYKISKILKSYDVSSKYGRKRCKNVHTSENTEKYIRENVYNQMPKEERREKKIWSMDFTEQKIQGKKVYTCGIISVNEKILVGYMQGKRCTSELAIKTVRKAIEEYGVPEILMTDRGSQFTSKAFYEIMEEQNIKHSMSRPHKPIDNVYIETFWKTMKTEIGKLTLLNEQTYAMVIEYYVNYYNNYRPHSSLGYVPPLAA